MSSALDRFGDFLIRASDDRFRLSEGPSERPVARRAKALRNRPLRALAGVAVICALGAAGSTLFGPSGNPRTTLSIECGTDVMSSATGNPVNDCETMWPLLYHEPAPHLVAWIASTGGAIVVVPKGTPPGHGVAFRRLPMGWTQDRRLVLLSHQLEDISTGLEARTCWSAGSAVAAVRAALRVDRLSSWHIDVHSAHAEGSARSCLLVAPTYEAGAGSVTLVDRLVPAPAHGSFRVPAAAAELRQAANVEREANAEISGSKAACASVPKAAASWRSRARQAGIPARRYVVFRWPDSPVLGGAGLQSPLLGRPGAPSPPRHRCAHIYVTAPGGGGRYEVYVVG